MKSHPPASHHIAGAYAEDDAGSVLNSVYVASGPIDSPHCGQFKE